ncbi:MAG: hypothetical protein IKQ29_00685 [Bacilli bacterium]|nr:hypothetical protein [Bacilli bacterium]
MKKKLILIFLLSFILFGCKAIQDMSIDEVIDNSIQNSVKVYNKYRRGYKYFLPKGLDTVGTNEFNEVIAYKNYKCYLYVDVVSYYNKIIDIYEPNKVSYISKQINYEDKYGYVEVNQLKTGKYFIEIMYNYAKIEVIVNEKDINLVVSNSLSVLNSIKFDTNILKLLLDEETSKFKEYEYDIFKTATVKESEYLQAVEEEIYDEDTDVHDSDLIG